MSYRRAILAIKQQLSGWGWLIGMLAALVCLWLLPELGIRQRYPQISALLLAALGGVGALTLWRLWQFAQLWRAVRLHDIQRIRQLLVHAYGHDALPPSADADSPLNAWRVLQTDVEHLLPRSHAINHQRIQLPALYQALSQCNQAILQSVDQQQLFAQVCRIIVNLGHAATAWIGELEADSKQVHITVAFGHGADYVARQRITLNPTEPEGRGPSGLSMLSDHPYWLHDFQTNPMSVRWHAQAVLHGWQSAAFLPLHGQGRVVGCLVLFASDAQAFSPAISRLLLDMAANIDAALNRFATEAQSNLFQTHLQLSEQRAQLVLENALDAIINIDMHGRIVEWNRAACQLFGYAREEVIGEILAQVIVPPLHRQAHQAGLLRMQQGAGSAMLGKMIEITALRRDGSEFPIELTVIEIVRDEERYFGAFIRDISQRKADETRIRYLANYDSLTGLPNRHLLTERVMQAIEQAWDEDGQFALMFLDLDHFKDVNDTLGHRYGDQLLIALTKRLQTLLKPEDTVSRLGGDEFIFLLPRADHAAAKAVVERVLSAVEQPFIIDQYALTITASVGVAIYPDDGLDMESLQRNADVAMYRTKKESRNSYRFFSSHMQVQTARQLQLVNALRQAIAAGQLSLHYQPQVSLRNGQIIGLEALLRWQHPQWGYISPAEFIPLAENSGLIMSIGHWVLEQAIQQIKHWHQAGHAGLSVSVNLSSVQCKDPKLPAQIKGLLERYQVPASALELELTEGVALENPEGAVAMMDALNSLGVRLALDDFGTGYSSLSYLKRFKLDQLKVDQSFVRDISTDDEDKAIVMAIIQLARSLGLKTIAEGVETPEQQAFLQAQGCDAMQGYLYSKPLPVQAASRFLQQRRVAWAKVTE